MNDPGAHPAIALPLPSGRIRPAFLLLITLQVVWIVLFGLVHEPWILIGITATIVAGLFILVDPRATLFAVPMVTFLFPGRITGEEFIANFWGMNLYLMDWILIFALLSAAMHLGFGERLHLPRSPLLPLFLLFFAALAIAAVNGLTQGNAFRDVFADFRLFFYYTGFFLVLVFARSFRDLEGILWSVIVFGTLGAIPEIIQSVSGSSYDRLIARYLPFIRIQGFHEVNYPMQFVASIALFPFVGTATKRTALAVSIFISSAALFLSYTRGSWIAAAGGILFVSAVLFLFAPSVKRAAVMLVLGLVGGVLILGVLDYFGLFSISAMVSRSTMTTSSQIDVSSLARLSEWSDVLTRYATKPLFGLGLGTVFSFYVLGLGQVEQIYVHNSYLYVLSKMGIVGFLPFAAILVCALALALKSLRRTLVPLERGIIIAFAAILVTVMVKAATTWHLNTLTSSLFVGVVFGAIASSHRWLKDRHTSHV